MKDFLFLEDAIKAYPNDFDPSNKDSIFAHNKIIEITPDYGDYVTIGLLNPTMMGVADSLLSTILSTNSQWIKDALSSITRIRRDN